MDDTELAWAAGIIDGEGCISIRRRKPKPRMVSNVYTLALHVKMAHKPTIEKLQNLFDVGYIYKQPTKTRTTWRWEVYNYSVIDILCKIKPYLFTKFAEIEAALQYESLMGRFHSVGKVTPTKINQKRDELYLKLRELKTNEYK